MDTNYTGIATVTKNPNAAALDPTLTDNEPMGATGDWATSLGGNSSAQGKRSVAEGTSTVAKGSYSHVEGSNSVALGACAHAEGGSTVAKGTNSHSEGNATQAINDQTHAEGDQTIAAGYAAHAGGILSQANGDASFVSGSRVIANNYAQAVVGKWNDPQADTLFEVGCGYNEDNRRNAFAAGDVSGESFIRVGNTEVKEQDLEKMKKSVGYSAVVHYPYVTEGSEYYDFYMSSLDFPDGYIVKTGDIIDTSDGYYYKVTRIVNEPENHLAVAELLDMSVDGLNALLEGAASGALNSAKAYTDSVVEDVVYFSEENQESAVVPLNADTLQGLSPSAFAPAGYGLGENVPVDIDHLDLANGIGWFRSNEGMESLGLTSGWWFGNYIPYGDNEGVWELNHYLDGLKANIRKVNGVLQPAEWVNPPMVTGEEYRTTERYGGKPVYVRAVDCGNIPNATHKTITYGEENCMAIFVYGATNYVGTVPSMNVGAAMGLGFNSDQVISLWGNRNTISIACGGDRSSASLVCVVKYYKTTD